MNIIKAYFRPDKYSKTETKTPALIDELFKGLVFAPIGELVAICIYTKLVYLEQHVFIKNWFIFELLTLFAQLYVAISYRYPVLRLPISLKNAYIASFSLSFISLPMLALFYTFNSPQLIVTVGTAYVALTSGGNLLHCYIDYIHAIRIVLIFSSFALICFIQGGLFTYMGCAGIIYAGIMIFSNSELHQYLISNFVLSNNKEEQVHKIKEFKTILNQKHKDLKKEYEKLDKLEHELIQLNDHLMKNNMELQKNNHHRKQLLNHIYNTVDEAMFKTNNHGEIIQYNEKFLSLFRIVSAEELRNFPDNFLTKIVPNHSIRNYFPFSDQSMIEVCYLEVGELCLECRMQVLPSSTEINNIWFIKDVTEQVKQKNTIFQMVHFDVLTNLPNRTSLNEKLKLFSAQALQDGKLMAIAFIDLNDFKIINDSQGHGVGNEILKFVADRLQKSLRDMDFAARLGGDEFICVFNNLKEKSDVDPLIRNLKSNLEKQMFIGSNTLIINASVGVSFYPSDTLSLDDLIGFADIAMYRAKENRHSLYEVFMPQYTQEINELHEVGQQLKGALINDALYLEFQPIYEMNHNEVAKVEVLLRWNKGISPMVFIPLAEKLGLINDIGLWVLEQACMYRLELAKIFDKDIKFCINISSQQLQTPQRIEDLLNKVKNSPCDPKWIEFELTESILVDFNKALTFINQLNTIGVTVAIDDFGTGFSSLSYLKSLYFDSIKIDKQFISTIFDNPREMKLFLAITHLSHRLGAKITVEGVETKEQYDLCRQQNCHFIQGFYLSKPVNFDTLIEKIRNKS